MFEAEFAEDEEEHLEVVFLLVADGVDLAIQPREILEPQEGSADVLRHVDGGSVFSEKELLIESISGEVHPD